MKIGIDQTVDRMTIRQEFVKAAMQGLIPEMERVPTQYQIEWIAEKACEIADATLKHESETQGKRDALPPIREPRDNAIA